VGRLIARRHVGPHRWRYRLEPDPAGIRVTETWDASYHNPVTQGMLKAAAESGVTSRP
jgi:hypothetical protein